VKALEQFFNSKCKVLNIGIKYIEVPYKLLQEADKAGVYNNTIKHSFYFKQSCDNKEFQKDLIQIIIEKFNNFFEEMMKGNKC